MWGIDPATFRPPAHEADNLTGFCESIFWEPRGLTTLWASAACCRDSFAFLYEDDVRTSVETHASTVCYEDSFAFLYEDDVRTSQETHASTVLRG
jgi:hypothetical protein